MIKDNQSNLEKLNAIFKHSNDAILFVDLVRDQIIEANIKATKLLEYDATELLSTRVSDIHPHEMGLLNRFADQVVKNESGWTNKLTCVTKKNNIIETEISASMIKMDNRECLVMLIRDTSEREKLKREIEYFKKQANTQAGFGDIVGTSHVLQRTLEQVAMVAKTEATVLIQGETGTGKELIAIAVHEQSQRSKYPFVKVNCASIPSELFESEFFGHIKGAFTGAIQNRVGRFELAEGGTLFLDEVSEIPLLLQGKLLRALQENQYERVGDSRTRKTNIRIVAATNKDLLKESKEGRFRADLYYRLSTFPIELPPLRDRREDIPLLAKYFSSTISNKYGFESHDIPPPQLSILESQDWPGNIRELQNVIERAVIRSGGRPLVFDSMLLPLQSHTIEKYIDSTSPKSALTLSDLEHLEAKIISRALEVSGGRIYGVHGAAAQLELAPTTLAYRIKKLRLR